MLTFYSIEPKVCPKHCKDCGTKEVREKIEEGYLAVKRSAEEMKEIK